MYTDTRKLELIRGMVVAKDSSNIGHRSLSEVLLSPFIALMSLLDYNDYRGVDTHGSLVEFVRAFEVSFNTLVPLDIMSSVMSLKDYSIDTPKGVPSTPADIHNSFVIVNYLVNYCVETGLFTEEEMELDRTMLKIQIKKSIRGMS